MAARTGRERTERTLVGAEAQREARLSIIVQLVAHLCVMAVAAEPDGGGAELGQRDGTEDAETR